MKNDDVRIRHVWPLIVACTDGSGNGSWQVLQSCLLLDEDSFKTFKALISKQEGDADMKFKLARRTYQYCRHLTVSAARYKDLLSRDVEFTPVSKTCCCCGKIL